MTVRQLAACQGGLLGYLRIFVDVQSSCRLGLIGKRGLRDIREGKGGRGHVSLKL